MLWWFTHLLVAFAMVVNANGQLTFRSQDNNKENSILRIKMSESKLDSSLPTMHLSRAARKEPDKTDTFYT